MNFTPTLISLPNDESYEGVLDVKMSTLNINKKDCDGPFEAPPEVPEERCSSPHATVRRSTRFGGRSEVREKDSLHKINRRTIMKPKRVVQPTTEKQIKAYYLNKKVVTKSTPLETIFEEPKVVKEEVTLLGKRKVSRSIKFSDGKHFTKLTIQNRRKRIKEVFGRAQKFKKISMEYFLEHFTGVKKAPVASQQEEDLPEA